MSNEASISHGSVIFAEVQKPNGDTYKLRLRDIKSKLATPVAPNVVDKHVSAASLLSSSTKDGGQKMPTMKDWVVARLTNNPSDVKISAEAVNKFTELANLITKSLKTGLRSGLKGDKKFKSENLDNIANKIQDLLRLVEELDSSSNAQFAVPSNLVKEPGMDDDVADFIGIVLGNYLDSEVFVPTITRATARTIDGKTPEVKGSDVDKTRVLLQEAQ